MLFLFFFLPAAAILLHEGGHILALFLCGGRIRSVRFSPLGITLCTNGVPSYGRELAVSLAGPFAGLLAFFLFRGAGGYFGLFAGINLAFSLFNMLPIGALDGGKAFYALLCLVLPWQTADFVARTVSFLFTLLLWMTAIFLTLILDGGLSLYFLSLWLFAFGFLKNKTG